MSQEVAAKQATFIIVTPSALQEWSGGKQGNQRLGPYVNVLHTLAMTRQLALVDLNARSLELLNQIGQEAAKEIYIDGDKAHFTKKGATQMAQIVAQELKKSGSPLGAYVKP
jgi:lysophospholipase L1-like esterase